VSRADQRALMISYEHSIRNVAGMCDLEMTIGRALQTNTTSRSAMMCLTLLRWDRSWCFQMLVIVAYAYIYFFTKLALINGFMV